MIGAFTLATLKLNISLTRRIRGAPYRSWKRRDNIRNSEADLLPLVDHFLW